MSIGSIGSQPPVISTRLAPDGDPPAVEALESAQSQKAEKQNTSVAPTAAATAANPAAPRRLDTLA